MTHQAHTRCTMDCREAIGEAQASEWQVGYDAGRRAEARDRRAAEAKRRRERRREAKERDSYTAKIMWPM